MDAGAEALAAAIAGDTTSTDGRRFAAEDYLPRLLARRRHFGITRLGDVTGLDRIGVPVAQAVRPLARSNAVNQGKGRSLAAAGVSAILESVETLAGEDLSALGVFRRSPAAVYGAEAERILRPYLDDATPAGWAQEELRFVTGLDLADGQELLVPHALVATDFTGEAEDARTPFLRSTTGLESGRRSSRRRIRRTSASVGPITSPAPSQRASAA